MQDLIKETIEKIKDQGIIPRSRWKYLLKKYSIWAGFGVIILLGAISFSIAFDLLSQLDWDLYRFAHQSAILYSLSLLPYFWIVIIGIFLVLAFFDLRKTETGYKYNWLKMSLASTGGIVVAGFVFFLMGLGGGFNALLVKDIPYYGQHMVMNKETQWSRPDSGFMAGLVTTISSNRLEITDLNGQKWNIILDEKTLIRPVVNIVKGEMIKIIGLKMDTNIFRAIEIRPWVGQGVMNNSGRGMMRGD